MGGLQLNQKIAIDMVIAYVEKHGSSNLPVALSEVLEDETVTPDALATACGEWLMEIDARVYQASKVTIRIVDEDRERAQRLIDAHREAQLARADRIANLEDDSVAVTP